MSDPASPVRLRDGTVAIGGRPVLRGVDLTLSAGEFVALMGANGSGKSTLVKALVGLRPLVSGELRLFGSSLETFTDWHRIGFVPQRTGASSGVPASVWEIVASGRLSRRRLFRVLSRADKAAIAEALDIVGLTHRAGDGISQLSGGQQQRALIARALAAQPELFFLDEPTAGVDLPNQRGLARALTALKDRGSTIVLVAHELGPLAPLVERAVVMRDGRLVYDGAPLAEHAEHDAGLAGGLAGGLAEGLDHGHHHGSREAHDHAPHIASPLEGR